MLTIPNSIKALFQTDGIRKNFRVQFPNGEFSDITNDNVVQESVKFTESLCSQSTFKFGPAEASVLEFETVGVGNMFGMTIKASIEIDTSSLSAADIAAIQADEGDGTLVLAGVSDIGYGFYRVPLGVFRVDSCPRDHQSMARRQVTAYGNLKAFNPVESEKLNVFVPEKIYAPNAYYEMLALLGYRNKSGILSLGFTEQPTTEWRPKNGNIYISLSKTVTVKNSLGVSVSYGSNIQYYYAVYPTTGNPTFSTYTDTDRLYAVDLHGESYNAIADVAAALSHEDIDLEASGYDSWEALATDIFYQDLMGVPMVNAGVIYEVRTSAQGYYPEGTLCTIKTSNDAVYPYMGFTDDGNGNALTLARFFLPYQFVVYNSNADIYNKTIQQGTVTAYEPTAAVPSVPLSIAETATEKLTKAGKTYSAYSHGGNIDSAKFAEGFLEVNALFALLSRTGALEFVRLDNSNPLSIVPGDYSECWWDEFDVEPIGTVSVTYKNKDADGNDQETAATITIGTGASVYDMTGNEVLKNIESVTLPNVSAMIQSLFAPYVGAVAFTPFELDMQGWPWLEAGDALEIEAEDGTIVETYALRVEMSGIQNLQATITAEGGEIIEEVE